MLAFSNQAHLASACLVFHNITFLSRKLVCMCISVRVCVCVCMCLCMCACVNIKPVKRILIISELCMRIQQYIHIQESTVRLLYS